MTQGSMNLSVPRGEKSVWDEPRWSIADCDRDRWMAALWGSGLVLLGSRRRGFTGGLLATFGSIVTARAAMGYHDVGVARSWINRRMYERGWRSTDFVHEALKESFPASDAPALNIAD